MTRPIVIVESPYADDVIPNVEYARAAMRDCLLRGEAPFASHLLYTQPDVLRDEDPAERTQGIEAGFAFREVAAVTAVYVDRGVSAGMWLGIEHSRTRGCPVEYRTLEQSPSIHLSFYEAGGYADPYGAIFYPPQERRSCEGCGLMSTCSKRAFGRGWSCGLTCSLTLEACDEVAHA